MIPDRSLPDFEEELLARFLHELEAASDRAQVVHAYTSRYPAMADELARLEEMNRLVAKAGDEKSNDDLPQQLGEFRIVKRIARGGMGEIYEAVQDRLNRRVVVKTIRRGHFSLLARGRFFREQRLLGRLHQTHIVPIHTAGEVGDLLYFVMPFIDGAPLSEVVQALGALKSREPSSRAPSLTAIVNKVVDQRNEGKRDNVVDKRDSKPSGSQSAVKQWTLTDEYIRSVAQIIADAAEALEYAHRLKIVHRDVKPSNVILDRQGQCWIIDFGLAGYVGQISTVTDESHQDEEQALTTGGIIGTPQYMSPEQWRGEPADVRSDVWGLGATLYELLTLQRAFDGISDQMTQDRVLTEEPADPRTMIANIPADLVAVCRQSLKKNPAERYPTAQALADDLRRWLRYEPVNARPARTVRRMVLWARRNPGWAASLVFLVLALIAAFGLLFQRDRRQLAEAQQIKEAHRQKLMLELRQARLMVHESGWRDQAWSLAREIRGLKSGEDLNAQAAALLTGWDVTKVKELPFGASSAAFDTTGEKLLLGGENDKYGRPQNGARLVDLLTGKVTTQSQQAGAGPVAFQDDGTPVHLAPLDRDRWRLVLWDISRQKSVREFSLIVSAQHEEVTEDTYPVMALSANGLVIVASTRRKDGRGVLRAWNSLTGTLLFEREQRATSLAVTPDGALAAGGDENGQIIVWSTKNGREIASLRSYFKTRRLCVIF